MRQKFWRIFSFLVWLDFRYHGHMVMARAWAVLVDMLVAPVPLEYPWHCAGMGLFELDSNKAKLAQRAGWYICGSGRYPLPADRR